VRNCIVPAASAALVLTLAGCGAKPGQPVAAASSAAVANDPLEIKTDANLMSRIKVGEPSWATVGASFTVAARVEVDDTRITRVGAPVMGRIATLAAREGEEVHRGQVLATLISPGLSDAQLELLKAISHKQVAQRAVERAQVLLKADVIGAAELQRREAELNEASAEVDAARDHLQLLGMPSEAIEELRRTRQMNSVSRVMAGMEGTVMKRHVAMGQVVEPADTVYEIADLSHVWLVADVPEQSSGTLRAGQAVEAHLAALPGRVLRGKLAFVSATVNPETRTVRVRMDVPNADKALKPAMLATMTVMEHTERRQTVPLASVVREGDTECLFVERGAETFVLREVKLGPEHGGRRVLLEGVREGERIVVDGAFHLNNERRRRSVRGEGS
jgi:cobalt-zinc-cadmium efflux system membrane fusion protein